MAQRRSIVGRRRSKSLGDLQLKDIKYFIDCSAPENEKLRMLTRYALRMALNLAEKKCMNETSTNPFPQTCSKCLEDIDSSAHTLYEEITLETRMDTTETEVNCPGFSEAKKKLEEESMHWDDLKKHYEESLRKENDVTFIPFFGSYDYDDLKKYDYSEVFHEIAPIAEEKMSQIEKMKIMEGDLKRYRKQLNCLKKEKVNDCIKLSNGNNDTPRTLIRRCMRNALDN